MNVAVRSHKHIPLAFSLIAAGPAVEIGDDYELLDVNALITKGREGFVSFTVDGDSMVEHIHPGDLVFVDTWAAPENGNIIACSVNGRTCVKIFTQTKKGLYLVSANTNYAPREVTKSDNFYVLGVVKANLSLYGR